MRSHPLFTATFLLNAVLSSPVPAMADNAPTTQSIARQNAKMAWWLEARFGMFIRWGVYSIARWRGQPTTTAEWVMNESRIPREDYLSLASQFNPTRFDAEQWVKTAADSGMKYIIITAKHHDGFCMFDTKQTNYNVVRATPWHKDPMAALSAACQRHGLRLGFSYSIMDWHSPEQLPAEPDPQHPKYNPTHFAPGKRDTYVAYMKAQLKELITQYHPSVIWFDGQWMDGWDASDGRELYRYLIELDPSLITNDRITGAGDYSTQEATISAGGLVSLDWETCMTINNTWGYRPDDQNFKSPQMLIRNLIDAASRGGNFLLNVAPNGDGAIGQPELDRLVAIGQWLKKNGEAIYGTSRSPFGRVDLDHRYTRKGHTLYVHVLFWEANVLTLTGIRTPLKSATFLATGAPATVNRIGGPYGPELLLDRPANPDAAATVVKLTFIEPPEFEDVPVARKRFHPLGQRR